MKTTTLGKSPLKVSRLCLGTMMFGDQTPLEEARAIVADAQEKGCNFIDTADVYTLGKSEEIVGQVLKGQRHRWVLASKVGNAMSSLPNESRYSRSWMLRGVRFMSCRNAPPRSVTCNTSRTKSWCAARRGPGEWGMAGPRE
jgi:aryl-alcohol dehydrogenase-like predicted oxidoreductase